MYIPENFVETRLDVLHAAIASCGLAIFVTNGAGAPTATHVPMWLDPAEGDLGTLHFHLARANPQPASSTGGGAALAIFPGPDGYISPNWYASKAEHGRVVPTWNYVTVHAEGVAEYFNHPGRLRSLVEKLTNRHEARQPTPWRVDDAPRQYTDAMLAAITGVRLPITRLQGAWKLGQNKGAADRATLAAGFAAAGADYAALAAATQAAWDGAP